MAFDEPASIAVQLTFFALASSLLGLWPPGLQTE